MYLKHLYLIPNLCESIIFPMNNLSNYKSTRVDRDKKLSKTWRIHSVNEILKKHVGQISIKKI